MENRSKMRQMNLFHKVAGFTIKISHDLCEMVKFHEKIAKCHVEMAKFRAKMVKFHVNMAKLQV